MSKKVAVLAVQGAFIEHERALGKLGCECVELRQGPDVDQAFDALVLPGGESTAQAKMLRELGMLDTLGVPAAGDPAGPVAAGATAPGAFGTLPVTVRRNAYGRQLGSFHMVAPCAGLPGVPDGETADIPMTFIRAPFIKESHEGAKVLARVDDRIVAVRAGNQIGVAFHPELDDDLRIHQLLVSLA